MVSIVEHRRFDEHPRVNGTHCLKFGLRPWYITGITVYDTYFGGHHFNSAYFSIAGFDKSVVWGEGRQCLNRLRKH